MSNFKHIPVNLSCKLFDALIRPIILYNSEIWFMDDYFSLFKAMQRSEISGRSVDKLSFADRCSYEKIHTRFCKIILGVRKTASNLASKAELGRIPLESFIKTQVNVYYIRINSHDINPLVNDALNLNKTLSEEGFYTWYSFATSIMKEFELEKSDFEHPNTLFKDVKYKVKRVSKTAIKQTYHNILLEKIHSSDSSSKLHLYSKLKSEIIPADYLKVQNFNSRKVLTKFRISDHTLEVELGRYKKIAREQRLCNICKVLDDEAHFFFNCKINETLRDNFLDKISDEHTDFNQLDSLSKLKLILNPNMNVLPIIVDFIKQSLELRK